MVREEIQYLCFQYNFSWKFTLGLKNVIKIKALVNLSISN